ncbi:hypothetical protein EMIHUDRAFT_218158 [Emiliania huxleyi CCMP1516]|uniref:Uncharacterized protein n=2 Tax=Emiliania huxleyi TaxID=2903 RepID=A0A0D3I8S4_EMIH1|nr:hypothetical protein EMIHUDRAFT_218158 [Emiliania huxleyi CCMP1516]EOD07659.1 hypothetical protein EMIHUDRAFT_218158 [Emiliania huxleyi CCMP1516]|eukprot:XP_005760088.1 hypothetical protein EMIHUDRAFT_218158 [Emiliania huxleyi CCMP1516]
MHDDTDQNGARLRPTVPTPDHVDRMVRPGVRSIVRYLGDRLGGSQAIAVWRALEKECANHSSLGRQLLQVLGGRLRGSPADAQARLMDYARALIDPQFSGLRAVAERLHASDKSTARALEERAAKLDTEYVELLLLDLLDTALAAAVAKDGPFKLPGERPVALDVICSHRGTQR